MYPQAWQLDVSLSAAMSSASSCSAWTPQIISRHVHHLYLKKEKIFHLEMCKKQLLATWCFSLMVFQRH